MTKLSIVAVKFPTTIIKMGNKEIKMIPKDYHGEVV